MKRSGFLKSLATLIAAPTLLKNVEIESDINTPVDAIVYPPTKYQNSIQIFREMNDLTDIESFRRTEIKGFVSSIDFLDQRDINHQIIDFR